MARYDLVFDSYCWQGAESTAPQGAGVFCVYSCERREGRLVVDRLLYIGHSANLKERLLALTANHELNREPEQNRVLFYSYAIVAEGSAAMLAAAMVSLFCPAYGGDDETERASEPLQLNISGRWAFRIVGEYTVSRT